MLLLQILQIFLTSSLSAAGPSYLKVLGLPSWRVNFFTVISALTSIPTLYTVNSMVFLYGIKTALFVHYVGTLVGSLIILIGSNNAVAVVVGWIIYCGSLQTFAIVRGPFVNAFFPIKDLIRVISLVH